MSEEAENNAQWQLDYVSGPYNGSVMFASAKEARETALLCGYDRWRILKVEQVDSHNW